MVFRIHLHIIFVTKYRRKVLTQAMLKVMRSILERVLMASQCILPDFNGEPDHVHLLIDVHPDNNISDLVASLKSASSRVLRQEFKAEIDKVYWVKLNFGMIPSASFPVVAHRLK